MKVIEIGSLPVGDIFVEPRLRDVDENWVSVIAETMLAKGQLQDIIVRQDGNRLVLVDGAHRLAAAKKAGLPFVQARIVEPEDADEALEVEVITTVARAEMTALDKAIHIGILRDIHKRRSPASTRGGDKKSKDFADKKTKVQVLYFDQVVAESLKLSRASIYNYLGLYDRLDPKVRQSIKGTPLADNMAELRALAAEEPKEQPAILELVMGPEPKATSINQAVSIHFNDIDTSTPDERDFARFVKLWSRASKKLRKNITSHIAKEQ